MFIRRLEECPSFVAGDATRLREILHPDKELLEVRYSLAHATLPAGSSSLPHRLKTSEVYYILSGDGCMHIEDEMDPVSANQTIYIPPGAIQWIENTGATDLIFLCIVDPAWQKSIEEVLP